jgi:acyl-coenzyme A thioesterase PaaI-like protein
MTWWLRHVGWWPPLLGTGIKVTRLDKDLRAIDVEMPLRPWNRNYVGVQFGGSLFAMTDPFYMIMLATNLGREYVVWDKAASIRYKRPGQGRVRAEFRLTEERLKEIRSALDADGRYDARFVVEVKDADRKAVAEVERVIYCATKDAHAERKKMRDGVSERGSSR